MKKINGKWYKTITVHRQVIDFFYEMAKNVPYITESKESKIIYSIWTLSNEIISWIDTN